MSFRKNSSLALVAAIIANSPAAAYETEIRWTSYGIPHVKAGNWGSLGYGFAYATATDAFCVIAKDVMMVNGDMSLHLGADGGNFESDVFHRAVLTEDRLRRFAAAQSGDMRDFSDGYAAGYNRFLEDNGGRLPQSCAGKPWLRPITSADVAKLTVSLGVRYGLGRFGADMARAAPPGEHVARGVTRFDSRERLGSNAIAFGRDVTDSGRGILFGNPHYPWHGSSRFHVIHTTIPGMLDSMGASLYTTNFVAIGFNRDIAWSHTVSTALRFTLYELSLNPDNVMEYRYGEEMRPIETRTVEVRALDGDEVETRRHQVYLSHYGPILMSEQLPWTHGKAYAIRDATLDNTASSRTYTALNTATSIDDVEAAISEQGVYWTNTIAADRHGTAFYADISGTPNVDEALLERCRVEAAGVLRAELSAMQTGVEVAGVPSRIVILNGADPACEWKNDARSKVAGTLPAAEMPRIRRDDYVTNSNDSYWLSNPHQPLEGYSPVIGSERTARSLRTRAGLSFVEERLAGGKKVTPGDVQDLLYSHRNYGAELLLDDVLEACDDGAAVSADGAAVDISESCNVLRDWDRTAGVDSRGNHIWTEFWRIANSIHDLYRVPFDPADPVNTPRGINLESPEVVAAVRTALARAQVLLRKFEIPLDARWGDIQYAERNGSRIPVPGGEGGAGMFSLIVARLQSGKGYTPIIAGNSYIHVISWDSDGNVQPKGMLTYSQSAEPESAHYADLTELYARGGWIDLPFTEDEIAADPNLSILRLTGEP